MGDFDLGPDIQIVDILVRNNRSKWVSYAST